MKSKAKAVRFLRNFYWERVLNTHMSNSMSSVALAVGIAIFAMIFVWAIDRVTGNYMTSVFMLALILIGLILSPILTTTFGIVLSLFGDFFYIPPIGTVLDTTKGWEHLAILSGIAFLVSWLTHALRRSVAEQIELKAAKMSIDEAVKLISHDLRNPLSGIKMRAQLIQDFSDSPEKQLEMAAKIEQSCDRMDAMIQSIIDASLSKSNAKIDLAFADLTGIVRETIDESFLDAHKRIELDCASSPVYGVWGRDLIKRALENLIGNAIKYGSPHERIKVKVFKPDRSSVSLSVHNFGNEIRPEQQEKIFSTFVRGETAKKTVGWGIGLAMVRKVAEAHEGTVTVNSGQGMGTWFTLNLPVREGTVNRRDLNSASIDFAPQAP